VGWGSGGWGDWLTRWLSTSRCHSKHPKYYVRNDQNRPILYEEVGWVGEVVVGGTG